MGSPEWLRDGWEIAEDGSVAGPVWPFRRAGGEMCDRVSMRRMRGSDLKVIDQMTTTEKGGSAGTYKLIGRLTGLTSGELDDMDAGDLAYLAQVAEVFGSGGHTTGGRT